MLAPARSAANPAARQRPRPEAEIVFGGEVSAWRRSAVSMERKSRVYRALRIIAKSLRLDARALDHLAPFLSFIDDEFAEIGRRHCTTQVGAPRLALGID